MSECVCKCASYVISAWIYKGTVTVSVSCKRDTLLDQFNQ